MIIPVYNAERYISKCLDSVFFQETKYTYLVKTINDSSTDKSLSILKEYQKEHDNLQIITIQNSGACAARNEGLKHLNSDYVYFIDADDTITPDYFELLLDKAYSTSLKVNMFIMMKRKLISQVIIELKQANIQFMVYLGIKLSNHLYWNIFAFQLDTVMKILPIRFFYISSLQMSM